MYAIVRICKVLVTALLQTSKGLGTAEFPKKIYQHNLHVADHLASAFVIIVASGDLPEIRSLDLGSRLLSFAAESPPTARRARDSVMLQMPAGC